MNHLVAGEAQDRRTKDHPGVGVDHHFHEAQALASLHGAPDTAHRASADQYLATGLQGFALRHAGAAEWRVDEHGIGRDAIRHRARVVVEEVGSDDLMVVVRRMREGAAAVAIAKRPDARDTGAQLFVDLDIAASVGLDACLVEPKIVGVGHAPDRQQQVRAVDFGRTGRAIQADSNMVAIPSGAKAVGIEPDFDALGFQYLPHCLRHILIFALDQARTFFDDGHPGPKAPVHLAKLEADVAAANDDQVLRQEIHVHHARVGEVRYLIQPGHGRDQGAAADVTKICPASSRSPLTRTPCALSKRAWP